MADVLFVHQNFPGQFWDLAPRLRAAGHRCVALASSTGRSVGGMPVARWTLPRARSTDITPAATWVEGDLLRAEAASKTALTLRAKGLRPAVIIGHPGWGETLYLREVFPDAKLVLHGEWFFQGRGAHIGFDPEFEAIGPDQITHVQARNLTLALAYADADRIVCPTTFQASVLPRDVRGKISVIHEGVDTDETAPDPAAVFVLPDGRVLDRRTPVVTLINRNFEPLRGFHIFMRALPELLNRRPDVQVLLIGRDEPHGYGPRPPPGRTWRQVLTKELGERVDWSRVHFTGALLRKDMVAALSVSAAHVYFTYPYVLSWSLLDAMAAGALVIGSDTAPVAEVVEDGRNGLLRPFFDVDGLADTLLEAVAKPARFEPLRAEARRTAVERFDRERVCRPAWRALLDPMLGQGGG